MANRPHFGGWPPQPPPPPARDNFQSFTGAGDEGYRPSMSTGVAYPSQSQPRANASNFHYSAGTPPAPFMSPGPSYGAFRGMQPPPPPLPGYNAPPGWGPYPRGFAGMAPNPRVASPAASMMQAPPQSFPQRPGYGAQRTVLSPSQAIAPPRQGQQSQAQGQQAHAAEARGLSVVRPRAPEFRHEHVDAAPSPLFCSWIRDATDESSLSQLHEDDVLGNGNSTDGLDSSAASHKATAATKVAEIYKLVDQVEETISKILGVINLQSVAPGSEWCSCPFDPHHGVPLQALFRHSLQCPATSGCDAAEVDSILDCLQYPHTAQLDPSERFSLPDEETVERRAGAEHPRNNATLSFEDTALLSVSAKTSRPPALNVVKQEPCEGEEARPSETSAAGFTTTSSVAGTVWTSKAESASLASCSGKWEFDPTGSLFFYRESPGAVLTSSYPSTKAANDVILSMPHSLMAELESDPVTPRKCIGRAEDETCTIPPGKQSSGRNGGEADVSSEGEGEFCGAVKGSTSTKQESCSEYDTQPVRLLPSLVWSLEREVEAWTDLPTRCSGAVLEAAAAAAGLERVRKSVILEWLLVRSPSYGVVLDVAMASHIRCLVQLVLKAVRTQSSSLLEEHFRRRVNGMHENSPSRPHKRSVECPVLADGGAWLAACLSQLYGPAKSKAIVLDLVKHCLKSCGRVLANIPLEPHLEPSTKMSSMGRSCQGKTGEGQSGTWREAFLAQDGKPLERVEEGSLHVAEPENCSKQTHGVRQVGASIDAFHERAALERYVNSGLRANNVTKPQMIAEYAAAVRCAEEERARRPTFRAVCAHDGLTWQRSQQEERKNKTKAELLAEERDYKRRRMSYRGKKLKRTPIQVLHDIIEGHMAEIAEAGGIGCFAKQPLLVVPSTEPKTEVTYEQTRQRNPPQSDFAHHSGSVSHPTKASIDRASYAAGLAYDRQRGSHSPARAVRNEARSDSRGRSDHEHHHDLGR